MISYRAQHVILLSLYGSKISGNNNPGKEYTTDGFGGAGRPFSESP